MEYSINKGIGKPAEFKNLKSQYLFLFAGGLLGVFVLFVILYMIGIDQLVCISLGIVLASALIWGVFFLNARFGEFGLMKLLSRRSHPVFIINRKKIPALFVTGLSKKKGKG